MKNVLSNSKSLERQADQLLGVTKKRKTRRGKKKKPAWVLKREQEKAKAMKEYKKQKRQRWLDYQEFQRKIHVD